MNQKKNLWLHVGPSKTGTTSIQKTLHNGRNYLDSHEVAYPRRPDNAYNRIGFAHHFLADALIAGDNAFVCAFVDSLILRSDNILSSEKFMLCGEDNFLHLSNALSEKFSTKVIYYVRNPVDFANSMAQQFIKANQKTYQAMSDSPPIRPLRKQIESLFRIFGEENVVVRKFDTESFWNGDLVADFLHSIGREDVFEGVTTVRMNESITLETAFKIEEHRRQTNDTKFIHSNDPRFIVEGQKFTLPEDALQKVRDSTKKDLSWLRAKFGFEFPR